MQTPTWTKKEKKKKKRDTESLVLPKVKLVIAIW